MKKKLFYYWNRLLCRNQNWVMSHVSNTPTIESNPLSDVVLYSIVSKSSINMYLLAVKSFIYASGARPRVIVQSDGTLDARDKIDLRNHIEGLIVLDPNESRHIVCNYYSQDMVELYDSPPTNLFIKYQLLVFFALADKARRCIHFDSDVVFPSSLDSVSRWMIGSAFRGFHLPGGNSLHHKLNEYSISSPNLPCNQFNAGFYGVIPHKDYREVVESSIRAIKAKDPQLLCSWELAQGLVAYVLGETTSSDELGGEFGESIATGWSSWHEIKSATVLHFVGSTRFRWLYYLRISFSVCRKLCSIPKWT